MGDYMYKMIELKYDYKNLEPYYNSNMFYYHYYVLYKKYTDNLNNIMDEFKKERENDNYSNIQSLEERLSFNANAYILHSLFFENLTPNINTNFSNELLNHIEKDFESYETFIDELSSATLNIQGPGWVIFGYNKYLDKLLIVQVENHMDQILIDFIPLLVIDVWEHSYYLQYKTNKEEYKNNLFKILDYEVASARYRNIYLI